VLQNYSEIVPAIMGQSKRIDSTRRTSLANARSIKVSDRPGPNLLASAILIYKTASPGTEVLSLPLTALTGGNLQAHPDQH
jgi:hypothetical protein